MAKLVKVGTGVVVYRRKDWRVLVGERRGSHGSGCIAFPGGHLDYEDETFFQAGAREVKEETGIICNVQSPDGLRDELFTTYEELGDGKKYATVYLLAEYVSGGTPPVNVNSTDPEFDRMVMPLEAEKCAWWRWMTIDEIEEAIHSKRESLDWIPFRLVRAYLFQHRGIL